MNKAEFLDAVRKGISNLPQKEIEKSLEYYSEIIDDYIEEGFTEQEAVQSIGTVDEVVEQIISSVSLPKLIKEKVKKSWSLRGWEIILIVISAPVWVPLLFTAVSMILTFYVMVWTVIISMYIMDFSLLLFALATIVKSIVSISNPLQSLLFLGMAFISLGVFVLMFFLFNKLTLFTVNLTKKIIIWIKSLFVRKAENV